MKLLTKLQRAQLLANAGTAIRITGPVVKLFDPSGQRHGCSRNSTPKTAIRCSAWPTSVSVAPSWDTQASRKSPQLGIALVLVSSGTFTSRRSTRYQLRGGGVRCREIVEFGPELEAVSRKSAPKSGTSDRASSSLTTIASHQRRFGNHHCL